MCNDEAAINNLIPSRNNFQIEIELNNERSQSRCASLSYITKFNCKSSDLGRINIYIYVKTNYLILINKYIS